MVRWCWVNFQCWGRLAYLDSSRARAYWAYSRCGWGLFGRFFSLIYHFSFLSPSLWETARYRLKYCLKGPLNPKQPTNQSYATFRERKNFNIFGLGHMTKMATMPINKFEFKLLLKFCSKSSTYGLICERRPVLIMVKGKNHKAYRVMQNIPI